MTHKLIFLLILTTIFACSSTKMVDQWKSPDTDVFEANKVLVVGISSDKVTRKTFEEQLSNALEKKGVHAVRSIDFFEKSFTNAQKSEKELNSIEKQLMEAGFDAVLFTTVTGSENKVTALQSYKDLSKTFQSFRDYYYSNQHLFHEEYNRTIYQIYHTETALYCICPGKERELLWKGYIDIVDPQKMERSVNEYVKVLVNGLEEKQLLVVK